MSGYSTNQLYNSDGYNLHARLIGALPQSEEDLFLSVALGFLFWTLCAGCIFRWRMPRKDGDAVMTPYKTSVLLGVAISCFLLGLGFWIRAGLANTPLERRSKAGYAAEQILFAIASLIWVDTPCMTVTRDEIIFEVMQAGGAVLERPLKPPKHWLAKLMLVGKVLVVVAAALYIYGFSQLPKPADALPPPSSSSSARLAASLIVFLIMLFLFMFLAGSCLARRIPGLLYSRLLVLGLNLFVFITALYNFAIVAVTDDYSPLVSSKLFFYFAYAFFPALLVIACAVLELNVYTGSREFKYVYV